MKKRMFKVLCVVLVMALLAPNVFAATPAPEVPLADEATVTRVRNEIATGQITDMEDVFLVAYQHLGADISEDGMTAYINEDGTLGFTQIIENNNADINVSSLNSGFEIMTFTVSTLAWIDDDGEIMTSVPYTPLPDQSSGSMPGTSVGVLHTAYYEGQGDMSELNPLPWIRISHMVTTISGAGGPHYVTKLVQKYMHMRDGEPTEEDSKTTTNIVSGSYTFTPSVRTWHRTYTYLGENLTTSAEVYISGVENTIFLTTYAILGEHIPEWY